jgi:chitin disaccharide deacetylase
MRAEPAGDGPQAVASGRPAACTALSSEQMIILCADDYAMSEGISRAVGELAAARRLSATSAIVTTPHWPAMAQRLVVHRAHLALGLHLNLTLGNPLGAMPRLAPSGRFPGLPALLANAAICRLDGKEIRAEVERQLDRFEAALGYAPDHIDGHQHVHVLPIVRRAVLEAAVARYARRPPLLRNPIDRMASILARRVASTKALTVGALSCGFARAAQRRGLPINDSFAGFSDFSLARPYGDELGGNFHLAGRRHIVMCHPGHADAELARVDAVVERRSMEYDHLMRDAQLPQLIWRPTRNTDGPALFWPQLRRAG